MERCGGMKSDETPADIPVVVLAGGDLVDLQGRRQPKACVLIVERPMFAHVVDHYWRYGFRRFLVCSGVGHEHVVEMANSERKRLEGEGGAIDVVFTGESAGTARRLREAFRLLPNCRTVAVSYVDIISDVDLAAVLETHVAQAGAVTLTAVNLPTRFKPLGVNLFSARVRGLATKPITEDTLVSGGYYFVDQKRFAEVVQDWEKQESFEQESLPALAASAALFYHKTDGYWQPIDSGRDVRMAEKYLMDQK
jgi:glucose-1-phosphate cytidylyltransferase